MITLFTRCNNLFISDAGSASIAQVHRAKLLDGRTVAVKVMRPGIEGKLLADVTNLKQFSKAISKALPVDYYKVRFTAYSVVVDKTSITAECPIDLINQWDVVIGNC